MLLAQKGPLRTFLRLGLDRDKAERCIALIERFETLGADEVRGLLALVAPR